MKFLNLDQLRLSFVCVCVYDVRAIGYDIAGHNIASLQNWE